MDAALLRLIVAVALVAHYLLQVVASVLNLRSLGGELPAEFRGAFDVRTYARSQQYTRARTAFGLVRETAAVVVLLAFWWLGGFEHLDRLVRLSGFGPVPSGLMYVGALGLGSMVASLPFHLYGTFVLEARFGFNRTSVGTFWTDLLKELGLAAGVGGPLLAAVVGLFQWSGEAAWIWCWAATAAFIVLAQFVAPAWILPLFNTFQPLAAGELRDAILAFARSVSFPLEGIYVMDGSRRSTKGNAFFTGFGRHKRIALFDTLIDRQTVSEVVAVVAHEIGHYKRHHVRVGLLLSVVHVGVLFWLLSLAIGQAELYDAFFVSTPSVYVGLVLFGLVFEPIELPLGAAMNALSRRYEYQADAFASKTTHHPDVLAAALKKLSADNLANLTPHPLHVWLHDSHPPLGDRLGALQRG